VRGAMPTEPSRPTCRYCGRPITLFAGIWLDNHSMSVCERKVDSPWLHDPQPAPEDTKERT
jgi:hypothetical protein